MTIRMKNGTVYSGFHTIEVVDNMAKAAGFTETPSRVARGRYMEVTSKKLAARGVEIRDGSASWFVNDLVEAGLADILSTD